MDFTTDSETIMTFLMKDFKTFSKKKTIMEQQKFDTLLLSFYKKIKQADSLAQKAWDTKYIKREIQEIAYSQKLKHNELLNSIFVPESIRRFIYKNIRGVITYSGTVWGKDITLTLNLMNDKKPGEFRKSLFTKEMVRHWQ